MPELPEVEHFRTLLLPLRSSQDPIQLERCSLDKKPPRKFLSDDDIARINNGGYCVKEVLRKGKQIAMILESVKKNSNDDDNTLYLMVHMGMTGRISTAANVPKLKELAINDYPPPCTFLKFTCGSYEACFSDPRKFGAVLLELNLDSTFGTLAPDAWTDVTPESIPPSVIAKIEHRSMGIKALLLDQKRAVCGVGNWVADEVLYQTQLHPDQTYLTTEQATLVLERLHSILTTAIGCLVDTKTEFPNNWLFHYRWNSKKTTKDAQGRILTFVTSGGRTSAIVPSIQKLSSQEPERSKTVPTEGTATTSTTKAIKEGRKRTTSPHFANPEKGTRSMKGRKRAIKQEGEAEPDTKAVLSTSAETLNSSAEKEESKVKPMTATKDKTSRKTVKKKLSTQQTQRKSPRLNKN